MLLPPKLPKLHGTFICLQIVTSYQVTINFYLPTNICTATPTVPCLQTINTGTAIAGYKVAMTLALPTSNSIAVVSYQTTWDCSLPMNATANTRYQSTRICYLIPTKNCNAITNYQITRKCSLPTNSGTVINCITNYQVTQNCSIYLQTVQLLIQDTKIQGSVT